MYDTTSNIVDACKGSIVYKTLSFSPVKRAPAIIIHYRVTGSQEETLPLGKKIENLHPELI